MTQVKFFSIQTLRSRQLVWKISKYLEKEMANKDREKDEMGFQITRRGQPRGHYRLEMHL